MRTTTRYIVLITVLLITFFPMGLYGEETEKEILDKVKLALFDQEWDLALKELDRLTEKYPNSTNYPQFLFYKSKCYEGKKIFQEALKNFTAYLEVSRNEDLKEEATSIIIDMNFKLYEKTDKKKHLDEIARYLDSKSRFVRYYAAVKLSYANDKTIAYKAVPTLKWIIANESDQDLVDRAKLALMRIDPDILKKIDPDISRKPPKSRNLSDLVLVIKATNKKTKKVTFSLSLPFALAGLAMDSLPKDAKEELREKGYDLDAIINTIVKKGEILKIESEGSIIKIWIE
jgi:tetratricopeptide (TPR) repeat protein